MYVYVELYSTWLLVASPRPVMTFATAASSVGMTVTAATISSATNALPVGVIGAMSPKPTVVSVVTEKYTASAYEAKSGFTARSTSYSTPTEGDRYRRGEPVRIPEGSGLPIITRRLETTSYSTPTEGDTEDTGGPRRG